jgi:hypothetical protein
VFKNYIQGNCQVCNIGSTASKFICPKKLPVCKEGDYPRNYDQDEDAKIASLYSDLTSCKSASSILIADLEWQSETDSVHRYKRLGGLYY